MRWETFFLSGMMILILICSSLDDEVAAPLEIWSRTYGGAYDDSAYSLVEASDGGFALVGTTRPSGGFYDFWLVRTDANGAMLWNCTYGGENWDEARALVETSDGGFALVGCTDSFGAGGRDAWLVKTEPIAAPTETPLIELPPTTLIAVASGASITATAAYLIYYRKKRNAKS